MRTTVTLDDELLALAHEMTGIAERSTLLHDGLRLIVEQEAARRLARLGGSAPDLQAPPRRRSALAPSAKAVLTKVAGKRAKPAR